jgi:alanine racemase
LALAQRASGDAACGAAVKADGYGLGAREVVQRLARRVPDFFVASWAEAAEIEAGWAGLAQRPARVFEEDMPRCRLVRPPGAQQLRRCCAGWPRRPPATSWVDTGIHRLGLTPTRCAAAC